MTTAVAMMRPSQERGRTRWDWLDSYHSFSFGDYMDPTYTEFGVLRVINEDWVAPGQGFNLHPHRDMEIITYVLEGSLAHRDSLGNGAVIVPGEIQRMTAGTGILHSEVNPSETDPVHLLQIWIRPAERGLTPSYEQKNLDIPAHPHGVYLIAGPEPDGPGVVIHQDVRISVVQLQPGPGVRYTVGADRQVWLQGIQGELRVDTQTLTPGDGLGLVGAGDLALEASGAEASALLFDMQTA